MCYLKNWGAKFGFEDNALDKQTSLQFHNMCLSNWKTQVLSLVSAYNGMLKSNPLLTKSVTSGVLAFAGALVSSYNQQVRFTKRHKRNCYWIRNLTRMETGLVPQGHSQFMDFYLLDLSLTIFTTSWKSWWRAQLEKSFLSGWFSAQSSFYLLSTSLKGFKYY